MNVLLGCFCIALLVVLVTPLTATSHGGGLNAAGCHTNRRTGDYHCHRAQSVPPTSTTYCHIVNNEQRCGYALSTCNDLVSQFGGYCTRQ